jgi:hypothetical protein
MPDATTNFWAKVFDRVFVTRFILGLSATLVLAWSLSFWVAG